MCLPLKLGVGLISMFIFAYGCFCMVAMLRASMFSGPIDLQSGGYNPIFRNWPVIVGIIGIFAGFFGFLGIYDDKPGWIRMFLRYLQVRLICSIIVFCADMYTLHGCESFASLPEDGRTNNSALLELSNRNMCYWGRIAYILGSVFQFLIDIYMVYQVWKYTTQIELNPPYAIDFGSEKYDTSSRWRFYGVSEPEELPVAQKKEPEKKEDPFKGQYGPDGVKSKPSFSPDGSRGPAYIRAFR